MDPQGNQLAPDDQVTGRIGTSAYFVLSDKVNAVRQMLAPYGWDYYEGNCAMQFTNNPQTLFVKFKRN
ncbi:hypothetical protein [Listeria ilorinensis]|uniref:hypothetical protein n=1 Tax=Listeria ilorinensis TaxID=2867439 RepID=UPI00336C0969